MVVLGSGSQRAVKDYELSRYACYLIAQNGDPHKEPIALAQTYFGFKPSSKIVQSQFKKKPPTPRKRGRPDDKSDEKCHP